MTGEELTAAIRQVQERARARSLRGPLGLDGVTTPDLMPLVQARDAAEAKVGAIGTVNPRPPGFGNAIIQAVKRAVARLLDWHVREQVEFNRAAMNCVQASLEALTDISRSLAALAAHHCRLREEFARELAEMKDIRHHWVEWRAGFEERRNASEIYLLRTVSELQAAFQHRVTLLDQNLRELNARTHSEFTQQLAQNTVEVQQRLWADLERVRLEYEALIHTELSLLRQKAAAAPEGSRAPVETGRASGPDLDWARFAEIFRGSRERIREHQRRHAAKFTGTRGEVLDLGCGRGEFLEAARECGVAARGVDSSREFVELCRAGGLAAEQADLFAHLEGLADRSLGGLLCSHVIEHLEAQQVPRLVKLAAAKLRPGARAVFETPNPECLAIFATHFYLDPTHTRPAPAALMRFYLEEAGFGGIAVERLSPAVEALPALAELPAAVRDAFFGGLDYAISGIRL